MDVIETHFGSASSGSNPQVSREFSSGISGEASDAWFNNPSHDAELRRHVSIDKDHDASARIIAACADLMAETLATAERIAGNAPIAVRQAKKSMSIATQVDRATGYMFELEAYNRMVPTEDRLEGVRAFNEKRAPRFTGR